MAVQGTPFGGLSEIARRVYIVGDFLTLVAYRNPANSLGSGNVASDLVQPALAGGYSPILLNGQWSVVNGVATYTHTGGGDPTWIVGASWGVTVVGAAMVYGSVLVHFRDNVAPFDATAVGKKLAITISNLTGP